MAVGLDAAVTYLRFTVLTNYPDTGVADGVS
jgi:hypothetical protein